MPGSSLSRKVSRLLSLSAYSGGHRATLYGRWRLNPFDRDAFPKVLIFGFYSRLTNF
ncbi:hypothetical protein SAMN02746095_02236 [Acidocella aminolytica 101 = DSM 11237]|nr:hypothetical protein SAMN02746095_02236 [Acidocella aminolytica 101 = DSM 11237]